MYYILHLCIYKWSWIYIFILNFILIWLSLNNKFKYTIVFQSVLSSVSHCADGVGSSTCSLNSSSGPCRLYVHGKSTHKLVDSCWNLFGKYAHISLFPFISTSTKSRVCMCATACLSVCVCMRVHSNFLRCSGSWDQPAYDFTLDWPSAAQRQLLIYKYERRLAQQHQKPNDSREVRTRNARSKKRNIKAKHKHSNNNNNRKSYRHVSGYEKLGSQRKQQHDDSNNNSNNYNKVSTTHAQSLATFATSVDSGRQGACHSPATSQQCGSQ